MRIQIGIGLKPNNFFDITIDPYGKYTEPLSAWNLSCEDNEANLIVCQIDLIHYSQLDEYLVLLNSKLRKNHNLILYGKNLNEINRLYMMGDMDEIYYNNLIYGGTHFDINNIGIYTPQFIRSKLQQLNYNIISNKLDNITYYIEAIR